MTANGNEIVTLHQLKTKFSQPIDGGKIVNNSITEDKLSEEIKNKLNGMGGGIVDLIYPIGSIYMSVSSTSPSVLFGGSWEKIEGKFIMSSDSSYSAGTTGGSNDAVVVSHNHSASTNQSGSHTHTGESDSDGSHTHTISGGSHSHSGSTSSAGSHTHTFGGNLLRIKNSATRAAVTSSNPYYYTEWCGKTDSAGSHSHAVTVSTSSSHSHTMTSAGSHYHILTIDSAGSHTHSVSVNNTGVDGTNKNMPAFISVNVWKRTA